MQRGNKLTFKNAQCTSLPSVSTIGDAWLPADSSLWHGLFLRNHFRIVLRVEWPILYQIWTGNRYRRSYSISKRATYPLFFHIFFTLYKLRFGNFLWNEDDDDDVIRLRSKARPNFRLSSSCKNKGEMSEMSEWMFLFYFVSDLEPNLWYTFDGGRGGGVAARWASSI